MWKQSKLDRAISLAGIAGLSLALTGCGGGNEEIVLEQQKPAQWTVVWEDNFDGSELDQSKWNVMLGDGTQFGLPAGWGNNEKQWYSNDNINVADGNLVITAKDDGANGMPYTSGRLNTANKMDIKYGRLEARIKVPAGQGLWPAFWALPTDSQYGGWASGGEIDVMEIINAGTSEGNEEVMGTIHYGMPWPLNQYDQGKIEVPSLADFHTYAIEWEAGEIRWYFDDIHFHTATTETWYSYYYKNQAEGYVSNPSAPFDQNFHMLLNLAVGGDLPGAVGEDTVFPAQMLVDYVRVSSCEANGNPRGCDTQINYSVKEPKQNAVSIASYELYNGEDSAQLNWPAVADDAEPQVRELNIGVAWDNNGAISAASMDDGGNTVYDITTSGGGNVAINAVDGEVFKLFGMGNAQTPWTLHAGEIKFDLYIDSANTPDSGDILIKMDSGWPALGQKVLSVADLEKDSWQSISVPVNDLLATPGSAPLDMDNVVNLFVIEFSSEAHVKLDNISLVCGHPSGCGITPPYSGPTISTTVEVFAEEINSAIWTNGMGAWDDIAGADYFDGGTGNHINWAITDSGDDAHGNVISVDFNADGGNGVFYIQSASGVDMSPLAQSGNLMFDVRVTTGEAGLTYKVDCLYPCTTGDQDLGVVGSEWQSVSVPVSDLIEMGLNIEAVNTGLVIFPTWGLQQGVSIEIDNIVWQGDDIIPPPPSEDVDVFVDGVNGAVWNNGAGAWDTGAGVDYFEADSGNHINWAVVDSGDAEHGNVMSVTFNADGQNGVFYIQSATGTDLSALADGYLTFDIRTTEGEHGFTYKVDCLYPCSTGDQDLGTVGTEWTTHVVSVADMIDWGLDITAVNTGLVIFPNWGAQEGVTFELDNIRWLQSLDSGSDPEPDPDTPPAGDGEALALYIDDVAANWELWNCCSGASFSQLDDGSEHGMVAEFTFDASPTVVGFQTTPGSGITHNAAIAGGKLTFDLKVVSAPTDNSGVWTLKVESDSAASFVELPLSDSNEGLAPTVGSWQTFTFDLDALSAAGLDLTKVDKLMVFPTWGTGNGAVYRIDNVEFKS